VEVDWTAVCIEIVERTLQGALQYEQVQHVLGQLIDGLLQMDFYVFSFHRICLGRFCCSLGSFLTPRERV
jgi:hypothetical protein